MTYEYVCQHCGSVFEVERSPRDEALRECPCELKCDVRRLISGGLGTILRSGEAAKVRFGGGCCGGGACGHG